MDYINLKGMNLSRIVLGTDGYSERIDKKTAYELMSLYIEHGGNVLDTARMYCGGMSEAYVGDFVRNMRDRVYISTKCSHPPLGHMEQSRLSKEEIEADIDASLKEMNIDYIDIIWLHRDDETKSVEPIIDALNEMVNKGKVRHFGASNWTHDRIMAANAYAQKTNQKGFCASQALYNMATRSKVWDDTLVSIEYEEKEKYDKSHLPVFAFCSQAKGFFEKYHLGELSPKTKERYLNEKTVETYKRIVKNSLESGDTISAAALKMLVGQSNFDVFPIIGPSNIAQLKMTLNIK